MLTAFQELVAHETSNAAHHGSTYTGTEPILREAVYSNQILGAVMPIAGIDDDLVALSNHISSTATSDPSDPASSDHSAVIAWNYLQGLRSKLSGFLTEMARTVTNNQASRQVLVDYGSRIESRLSTFTALSSDASNSTIVGSFRKDALAHTMRAIGTNTAKLGERPAQKGRSGGHPSSTASSYRYCRVCKKSNVSHPETKCPQRGNSPDRRARSRSPSSKRDKDNNGSKDGNGNGSD